MYECKLSVRGYELDSYGHVNNAVYLNYFEQARWEIFKPLFISNYFRDNQFLLVVTEVNVRYSKEVKLFDELVIRTRVLKEPPYLVFNQKMFFSGTKIKVCSATIKTLLMNSDRQIQDIPDELLQNLSLL